MCCICSPPPGCPRPEAIGGKGLDESRHRPDLDPLGDDTAARRIAHDDAADDAAEVSYCPQATLAGAPLGTKDRDIRTNFGAALW